MEPSDKIGNNSENGELLQFLKSVSAEDRDSLQKLYTLADGYSRQGSSFDLQGDPEQAQRQYLLALRIHEQLFKITGDPACAEAAREDCFSLADECMQQGNMHGADGYYGKALDYGGDRIP